MPILIVGGKFMTQKELSYLEDAVNHEKSLEQICTDTASKLKNASLVSFINNEINIHKEIQNELLTLLKEVANGR